MSENYIDDLLIISKGDFKDHMANVQKVFTRLRTAGLKVNIKKSFFTKGKLEYLGYWITRQGVQPITKKIEAVQKITTTVVHRCIKLLPRHVAKALRENGATDKSTID